MDLRRIIRLTFHMTRSEDDYDLAKYYEMTYDKDGNHLTKKILAVRKII